MNSKGRPNMRDSSPKRCAFCGGRLGLLVSHYWDLRFCSRQHKEGYLLRQAQERERQSRFRRWLYGESSTIR